MSAERKDITLPIRRRWFQFGTWPMLLVSLTVGLLAFGIHEHRQRLRLEHEVKFLNIIVESKTVRLKAADGLTDTWKFLANDRQRKVDALEALANDKDPTVSAAARRAIRKALLSTPSAPKPPTP